MAQLRRRVKALLLACFILFLLLFSVLLLWLQYPTAARRARAEFIQQTGTVLEANALKHAAGRPQIVRIVSIGDSYSDTGRLKARTQGLLVPDFAFFQGRCSNGPLWIEYVNGALGTELINHAFAGATTSAAGDRLINHLFLDFQEQVLEYFATHPEPIRSDDTIVTITGGGNNLFSPELRDFGVMKRDLGQVFRRFYGAGARRFVFLGIGNWRSPANPLDQRVAGHEAEVYEFIGRYHQEIQRFIKDLETELPGIEVEYINTDEIDQKSHNQPSEWGFGDVQSSCFKGDILGRIYAEPGVCAEPHATKFWEHFHLSSKMHCHIAVQALQQMNARGWINGFNVSSAHNSCRDLGLKGLTAMPIEPTGT